MLLSRSLGVRTCVRLLTRSGLICPPHTAAQHRQATYSPPG